MLGIEINGKTPKIGKDCFIADNATLIGDVTMGDNCSIWFNTVVRGDVNSIVLGNNVNVQDGSVVHCTYNRSKTILEDNVSVGHRAIVHGCHIKENVLIGMGSILMDNVTVNKNVIVAAGALVPEGKILESGAIYAGVPAKKIKDLNRAQINGLIEQTAKSYVIYSGWYRSALRLDL